MKYDVSMPVYGQELSSLYWVLPALDIRRAGGKQKMMKLIDDYSRLIEKVNGSLVGYGGEGRLKTRFVHSSLDADVIKLFGEIKALFDPFDILNPGVKQSMELKQLIPMLTADFGRPATPRYIPKL